jgi:hypothetical protein
VLVLVKQLEAGEDVVAAPLIEGLKTLHEVVVMKDEPFLPQREVHGRFFVQLAAACASRIRRTAHHTSTNA